MNGGRCGEAETPPSGMLAPGILPLCPATAPPPVANLRFPARPVALIRPSARALFLDWRLPPVVLEGMLQRKVEEGTNPRLLRCDTDGQGKAGNDL